MKEERRCKECNRKLRFKSRLNICSYCVNHNIWKEKYDELKGDIDRRFKLYDITIQSFIKQLRKYEPIEGEDLYRPKQISKELAGREE